MNNNTTIKKEEIRKAFIEKFCVAGRENEYEEVFDEIPNAEVVLSFINEQMDSLIATAREEAYDKAYNAGFVAGVRRWEKTQESPSVERGSFFDMPESEQKEIVDKAAEESNRMQRELVEREEECFCTCHTRKGEYLAHKDSCIHCTPEKKNPTDYDRKALRDKYPHLFAQVEGKSVGLNGCYCICHCVNCGIPRAAHSILTCTHCAPEKGNE